MPIASHAFCLKCGYERKVFGTMTSETETRETNPFWDFSLQFYRQPGVADLCLALQDRHGIDVNLMLYMLWLATRGTSISQSEVAAIAQQIKHWHENVVVPLRSVRRSIAKSTVTGSKAEFRNRVKALELEAERIEQDDLFALASAETASKSMDAAARHNLRSYAAHLGRAFDDEIEKLAELLKKLENS
ncbi:MAG TPA: TIGR02444 family protein [Xanthobacteraceae bacterium]|nr:TIGR02444 family protein [Xanthobacteraceae bacterium]